MEVPSKAFLLFLLLPDWLKLNHLKSRMECGFSDIFSRRICFTVAETIGVTNYAASFGGKNVQKTTFEAAQSVEPTKKQYLSNLLCTYSLAWITRIRFQIVLFSYRCVLKSIHYELCMQIFALS